MTNTTKATTDCGSPLAFHTLPSGGIANLDSFRTASALLAFVLVLLVPSIANGGQVYQLGQVYAEPFPVVVNQSKIVAEAGAYRYAIVDFPPGKHSLRFDVLDDIDPTTYVYFMDEINLASFLTRRQGHCIATPCGRVSRSHATEFSLSAPLRAYILVDNRKAVMLPARVVLSVLQPGGEQTFLRYWDSKVQKIQSILQIPPFPIVFKRCGVANAFSDPKGITMCYELYWDLEKTLGNKQLADSAYRWVLYHELGHALLYRFNLPAYNNEELADEFGAFLAVLLNETESIVSSAEYWNRNSSALDAIRKHYVDDRHPLSAQRARNLYSWLLSSNTLLSKWHTMLREHFQTGYLQSILAQPHRFPWANVQEITRELRMRGLHETRHPVPDSTVARSLSEIQSVDISQEDAVATAATATATSGKGKRRLRDADLQNGTFRIHGSTVRLANGRYEVGNPSGMYRRVTLDRIAYGDLNGDGWEDVAVLLGESAGGNLVLTDLSIVIDKQGKPQQLASRRLGGVAVESLLIEQGVVLLGWLEHGPDDAMCCPSVKKKAKYRLRGKNLVELK